MSASRKKILFNTDFVSSPGWKIDFSPWESSCPAPIYELHAADGCDLPQLLHKFSHLLSFKGRYKLKTHFTFYFGLVHWLEVYPIVTVLFLQLIILYVSPDSYVEWEIHPLNSGLEQLQMPSSECHDMDGWSAESWVSHPPDGEARLHVRGPLGQVTGINIIIISS